MKRRTWSILGVLAAAAGVAVIWLGRNADHARRALEEEWDAERLRAKSERREITRIDPRRIDASPAARSAWVREQARGPGARHFARDYEWILSSGSIGPKEAKQLAYLFFYSTGVMGGYFDDPRLEGDVYRLHFHPELGEREGFPVFVDRTTGAAWQEGQAAVDTLGLIRLFVAAQAPQPGASDRR